MRIPKSTKKYAIVMPNAVQVDSGAGALPKLIVAWQSAGMPFISAKLDKAKYGKIRACVNPQTVECH
jgi:hypothetical protein